MGFMPALFVGILVFSSGSLASAQMGPGMMGGQGMMGQGQTSGMPMQQLSEVVKLMADRLASREGLDVEKAERLRRLADQLVAGMSRMTQGMGGGMMGQGLEQMSEFSRILAQMKDLLRSQ
jgi:hypothetical protein